MAFPLTRRSVVVAAGSADPETRRRAFDALVAAYWKPVYKYLRLEWHASGEDADDLTQGFFARALEKGFFDRFDPGRARFRTYLRTCLDELLFPGTEHEMLSVYHLVGGQLVATHYCALGNQPHFKLQAATADELVFGFDGGTNFVPATDTHIHSGRIRLVAPDRLEANWTVFAGGKQTGSHRFSLTRKK